MNPRTRHIAFPAFVLVAAIATASPAHAGAGPVGSAFTYQGLLKSGGAFYTGSADFEFRLFETELGITQIGGMVPASAAVTDGAFTAMLDFGILAFNGDERWLEIRVRTPGGSGNPFVLLTPRQRLSAAPYAVYALNSNTPFNFSGPNAVFSGGNVGIGVANPTRRLQVSGGGMSVFDDLNQGISMHSDQFFLGSATSEDTIYHYAFATDTHTFATNGSDRLTINAAGRVGIGEGFTPEAMLHVQEGSAGAVNAVTSSLVLERSSTNFLTMLAPDGSQTGVRFGQPALGNNAAALLFNHPFTPGGMVMQVGAFNRISIDSAGNVGVGTGALAPAALLNVYEPDESTLQGDFASVVNNAGVLITTDFTAAAFTPGIFWNTANNNPTRPKAGIYLDTGASGASMHMGTSGAYGFGITNDAIVIDPAGDVGMGTATPEGSGLHISRGSAGTITANSNSKLVIEDNATAYINLLTPDASESGVLFGRPGSIATSAAGGIVFNNTANADGLQFRTGGNSTKMVLDSAGNLGIGTIAPTGRLHVSGSSGDASVVLPGNSIGQTEIFAEPGMASRIVDATASIGTSTFTLATRSITCPDDGYVIAIGTVAFIGDPLASKTAIIGILTSDSDLPADQDYLVKINSYETATVQTIRAVTAGSHSFFFQVQGLDTGITVEQRKLSLMYFPTTYGTADVD